MFTNIFCFLTVIAAFYFPSSVLSARNEFWIDNDGIPCLLLTLDANISINYQNTSHLWNLIEEEVTSPKQNQIGQCNDQLHQNNSEIIINTTHGIGLTFLFSRVDGYAFIKNVTVNFSFKNSIFKKPATKESESLTIMFDYALSKSGEYFECDWEKSVMFPNDVNFTMNYIKVQAFDVMNGTFNDQGEQCQIGSTTDQPTKTTQTEIPTISTDTQEPYSTTNPTETPEPDNTSSTSTTKLTTRGLVTTMTPTTSPSAKYYVENNGVFCLLLNVQFSLHLTNPKPINQKMVAKTFKTNNVKVNSSGSCYASVNTITLTWSPDESPSDKFNFTMIFDKSGDSSYGLAAGKPSFLLKTLSVQFVVNNKTFSESKIKKEELLTLSLNVTNPTKIPLGDSFTCEANIKYDLDKNNQVMLDHMEVEAFRNSTTQSFSPKGTNCPQDNKPNKSDNIVPIVVGVVLAALVIVVLIAYLIGRRRNRSGYDNI